MADLVFYNNISANALGASNNELVSKGQSDTNSCSRTVSGIGSWSSSETTNMLGQLRIYNGIVYRCNSNTPNSTVPGQSQYWDVCPITDKATANNAGLVKIGTGLCVSNGNLTALASRKPQKTISSGEITLDGTSVFKIAPSSNISFSFAASDASDCMQTFDLVVTFGSTVYDLAFPQSVSWSYYPSSFEANKTYIFQFSTFDSGETWYGVCLNGPPADSNKNSIIFTIQVPANTNIYLAYGEPFESPITAAWGDGVTTEVTTGDLDHTYATAGTYQVKLKSSNGKMPVLYFTVNSDYIRSVDYADVEWYGDAVGNTNLITVTEMFSLCEHLTSVPATLFARNNNIGDFGSCFRNCSGLESIPEELFGNNTSCIDFSSCFEGCGSLEELPSGLFSGFSSVTTFASCFKGCTSLQSIPADTFEDCSAASSFASCFLNCSSLTAIPSGLFADCTNVSNFSSCFSGTSITSISSDLFTANRSVTSFNGCFSGCRSLVTVPTDLFDNLQTKADFRMCFNGCSAWVPASATPYVPQVWEKDTDTLHFNATYCFGNTSASVRQYVPFGWGGDIAVYDSTATYSKGDWVYYSFGGVPKVYTYINDTPGSNHAPEITNGYWVYGYRAQAEVFVTFKLAKSGVGNNTTLTYYTTDFINSNLSALWTQGNFSAATLNSSTWQQADTLMMSTWSLSGGNLTVTLSSMGPTQFPTSGLSSGDVLRFGGFEETEDSSYYYATSTTYSKN